MRRIVWFYFDGRVFDVESGECLHTLLGHTAEIVSLNFDTDGQRVMTGSFDHTVKGKRARQL